jgi:putative aldouronate transport system permease protein
MSTASGSDRRQPGVLHTAAGERTIDIFVVAFFVVLSVTILYPFLFVLARSLSSGDATLSKMTIIPQGMTLANYSTMLQYRYIGTGFRNSVARVLLGGTLNLGVCILGAYPLSKRDLPHRTLIMGFIVFTMFFSGGLIPLYLLVSKLGLRNTIWALVLPTLVPTFSLIIMRNFFMTVDPAFEEAAFMDGAGYLHILFRIIAPLSKPVLATVALWAAVAYWNEWFHAMVFTTGKENLVLQLLLRRMIEHASDIEIAIQNGEMFFGEQIRLEGVKAAVTLVTIGPIVLAYPFFQRFFVRGILVGSLKG